MIRYNMAQYGTVRMVHTVCTVCTVHTVRTIWHGTVWYSTVKYGMVQCSAYIPYLLLPGGTL